MFIQPQVVIHSGLFSVSDNELLLLKTIQMNPLKCIQTENFWNPSITTLKQEHQFSMNLKLIVPF